jgi:hypothetical protein
MALFLLIFTVCMVVFGGMLAILLCSSTPRYRTEPRHLIELFDKALEDQLDETEWNAVIGYPIRHDDYLDGIRRRAHRLMDEHGRHWRQKKGGTLLDETGRQDLSALRNHLAAHTALAEKREKNNER